MSEEQAGRQADAIRHARERATEHEGTGEAGTPSDAQAYPEVPGNGGAARRPNAGGAQRASRGGQPARHGTAHRAWKPEGVRNFPSWPMDGTGP